jgi:hypothetical protein
MSVGVARERGRRTAGLGRVLIAGLLFGSLFIPVIPSPFVPDLSLFDLVSGAFSGGMWLPLRLLVLLAFAAALALLAAAVLRFVKAWHGSAV